jgi:hypothetical protein
MNNEKRGRKEDRQKSKKNLEKLCISEVRERGIIRRLIKCIEFFFINMIKNLNNIYSRNS